MIFYNKNIDKNLYLVILFLPFIEFINTNFFEFTGEVFLHFVFYSILILIIIFLSIFFIKFLFKNRNENFKNYLSLIIYLQFKFSLVKNFLSDAKINYDGEISLILILVLTVLITYLYSQEVIKNFIKIYFLFYFVFIIFSILAGFSSEISSKNYRLSEDKAFFNKSEINNITEKRNIYFIIADGMTSLQNFKNIYDVDTEDFKDFAELNKFNYYDGSPAYTNTVFNFTSTLNLDYIINEKDEAFLDRSKMYPYVMRPNLIDKYLLIKTLKNLNYKIVWEGSPHPGTCLQYNLDLCIGNDKPKKINNSIQKLKFNSYILQSFLSATPIVSIISRMGFYKLFENIYSEHKENDALGNFVKKVENYDLYSYPHFFLIHHMSPHDPWVFNSDCSYRKHEVTNKTYPIGYSYAYNCVLKRIKNFVNFINKNDPEAIVIIQGDHGHDFGTNSKEIYFNSSKTFNLIKLGKKCDNLDLKGKLDMVNSIRLALSCATGQKLKLVKKKTYLSFFKEHKLKGKVFLIENLESIDLSEVY